MLNSLTAFRHRDPCLHRFGELVREEYRNWCLTSYNPPPDTIILGLSASDNRNPDSVYNSRYAFLGGRADKQAQRRDVVLLALQRTGEELFVGFFISQSVTIHVIQFTSVLENSGAGRDKKTESAIPRSTTRKSVEITKFILYMSQSSCLTSIIESVWCISAETARKHWCYDRLVMLTKPDASCRVFALTQIKPPIASARTLLSHGCEGFLATIHDTTSDVSSIHDQPIVSEFQDYFPKNFQNTSYSRFEVLTLTLNPGAEQSPRFPYRRLGLSQKSLKICYRVVGARFIRPSVSPWFTVLFVNEKDIDLRSVTINASERAGQIQTAFRTRIVIMKLLGMPFGHTMRPRELNMRQRRCWSIEGIMTPNSLPSVVKQMSGGTDALIESDHDSSRRMTRNLAIIQNVDQQTEFAYDVAILAAVKIEHQASSGSIATVRASCMEVGTKYPMILLPGLPPDSEKHGAILVVVDR
ncbi:hypothetical protein Tco_0565640 [Tanacetum coccineum]